MSKFTSKTIEGIKKGDLIVLQGEGNRDHIIAGIITHLYVHQSILSDTNKRLSKPQNNYVIRLNDWSDYGDLRDDIRISESTLLKRLVKYVPAEQLAA